MGIKIFRKHDNLECGKIGTLTKFKDNDNNIIHIGDIVQFQILNGTFREFVIEHNIYNGNNKQYIDGIECDCNDITGEIQGISNLKIYKKYYELNTEDSTNWIRVIIV